MATAKPDQGTKAQNSQEQSVPKLAPIDHRSFNLPNLITISRLLLSGLLFLMIDQTELWLAAAGLFIFAASTDALDGYLARRYGQVTTLGRILDPFVDKIIVCGTFIFLQGVESLSGVSPWMVVIVISREMFVTSLRGFMEQQGLDFSADKAGKIKMVLQCVAVTACLVSMSPRFASESLSMTRDGLLWLAIAVTVYSGVSYIFRAAAMIRQAADGE